ncbi:MAG: APC family permease [Planctomycetota bacterium]|jgi:APA family basic amino acid/polyamine antiporter
MVADPTPATPEGTEGTEGTEATSPARTTLGLFDIMCVVVGGIIGVGIFFTPGLVAKSVDNAWQVITAWTLGGVVAIVGALLFAQLARLVHGHGGIFVYIHDAFGPVPAFLYGWCNWLVIQSGAIAVISLIVVDNMDKVIGGPATGPGMRLVFASTSILILTTINVLGVHLGRGVQNTLTVIKTLAVFALVALPLLVAAPSVAENVAQQAPEAAKGWPRAMAAAILPALFAYGGWQHGSFLGGAARRPARDVPLGIVFGVLIVVLAYITVNLAFLDMLGFEKASNSKAIAVDSVKEMLDPHGYGQLGGRMLAAMIVISALGVMNTILFAPPYVLHAMAKRRLFFTSAASLHARLGTPVLAVLVQGLWAVVLLLASYLYYVWYQGQKHLDQLDQLVSGVVFMDWLFFCLCGIAVFKLRRAVGKTGQEFGGVVVAGVFTVLAVGITAGGIWTRWEASGAGLTIGAVGFLAYALMRRMQSRPA